MSSCKESKTSIDSFHRYWWSKNPAIWLERYNWPNPTKNGSLLSVEDHLSIDSFHRYWLSKNPSVWLAESHLDQNWRTKFFPDMKFSQNHKEHCHGHFFNQKRHINGLGGIFGLFPQNEYFSEKFKKILWETFEKNGLVT